MKRLMKIAAIVIAIIIVVIVVVAIAFSLLFDPNDYKADITAQIEQKIGRDVAIPGNIELSYFPWLGMDIGRVTVANAPGFGDQPLAEITSAQAHVRLWPLIQGQVRIGTVSLDGLHLRLARHANGQTNWGGIVEHLESAKATKTPSSGPTDQGGQGETSSGEGYFQLKSLEIGSIEVTDAAVDWDDAMAGNQYTLSDFHLSTGHLAPGQPFDLALGAKVAAPAQDMTADMDLTGTVDADPDAGVYKLSDLHLTVQADGKAVPGGSQKIELSADAAYKEAGGAFSLHDLVVQMAGLTIDGRLDGKGIQATPSFKGSLSVAQFNPRQVLAKLGSKLPELLGDDALTRASMTAQFSGSGNSARLDELKVVLDDTTFTGTGSVKDFTSPAMTFDADVDAFDLDRYLPVGSTQKTTGKTGGSGGKTGQKEPEKIDLSALRGLDLDGKLHVGTLKAYKMTFNDASLALAAHNGVLTIKPLASGFYKGKVNVVARVDASSKTPTYSLKADLADLQFAPLLQDLAGTDLVSALASLKLDVHSAGDSVEAIKKALDGTISYDLRDGSFHGFNLAKLIQSARSQLAGKGKVQAAGSDKETPFNRLAGSFDINNGVLSGDSLKLKTKYLTIGGDGDYNLLSNNLDYTLDVHVDKKKGPLEDVGGLTVPVHLGGALLSPKYKIDLESALKAKAEERLDKEKDKAKKKLEDKLDKKLKDKLGDDSKNKLLKGLSNLLD